VKQLLDVLLDPGEFEAAKQKWRAAQEEQEQQEKSDVDNGDKQGGAAGKGKRQGGGCYW
jgi:hypothetical protein